MNLNKIKEAHDLKAHSRQERIMFLVPLMSRKVIKLNQMKEDHQITMGIWYSNDFAVQLLPEKICSSSIKTRTKIMTKHKADNDALFVETIDKKDVKINQINKAQGLWCF